MSIYEVIVGNVGKVYEGTNGFVANTEYQRYVGQSKRGYGRAAHESVILFRDGAIIKEYDGNLRNAKAHERTRTASGPKRRLMQ